MSTGWLKSIGSLRDIGLGIVLASAAAALPSSVYAAGGAFAVDDSEIAKPGDCKVESWLSLADNKDLIGAVAPACVVDLGRPVELSAVFQRFGSGGEWGTSFTAKGKMNLVPVEANKIGVALVGGTGHDLLSGEHTAVFFAVPVTFQVHEQVRLNVNAGWNWDRPNDRHFFTWGAGFEWNFVKPLTLIGEVFGQVGREGPEDPRFQLGLRYTPVESVDFDVIYGRNITGERANWITLGLNVRFSANDK
jgi:hypothetical protein